MQTKLVQHVFCLPQQCVKVWCLSPFPHNFPSPTPLLLQVSNFQQAYCKLVRLIHNHESIATKGSLNDHLQRRIIGEQNQGGKIHNALESNQGTRTLGCKVCPIPTQRDKPSQGQTGSQDWPNPNHPLVLTVVRSYMMYVNHICT